MLSTLVLDIAEWATNAYITHRSHATKWKCKEQRRMIETNSSIKYIEENQWNRDKYHGWLLRGKWYSQFDSKWKTLQIAIFFLTHCEYVLCSKRKCAHATHAFIVRLARFCFGAHNQAPVSQWFSSNDRFVAHLCELSHTLYIHFNSI